MKRISLGKEQENKQVAWGTIKTFCCLIIIVKATLQWPKQRQPRTHTCQSYLELSTLFSRILFAPPSIHTMYPFQPLLSPSSLAPFNFFLQILPFFIPLYSMVFFLNIPNIQLSYFERLLSVLFSDCLYAPSYLPSQNYMTTERIVLFLSKILTRVKWLFSHLLWQCFHSCRIPLL